MSQAESISDALSHTDFAKIKTLGTPQFYKQGALIFADGDNADFIYFIETGNVSIFIEKFTVQEEISSLGPGDCFGEMAFFSGDRRSASAAAAIDSTLVCVDKKAFLELFESDQDIADKINRVFSKRNQDLSFKEHLLAGMQPAGTESFILGIKGDPSLRFSALSRERYDSAVDRIIMDLQPRLYDLLVNRSAYEIFIHCNSGEVLVRSVFDPFNGDIHPATKLVNIAYVERHFPLIDYEQKTALIKNMYSFICADENFSRLPPLVSEGLQAGIKNWEPLSPREIASTISRLYLLRKIPNFYLRNFTISILRDAIRMQFNCDGTQIVNAKGFLDFIEQNLDEDDMENAIPEVDRRLTQRRQPSGPAPRNSLGQGERRSARGRRQEDWEEITGSD